MTFFSNFKNKTISIWNDQKIQSCKNEFRTEHIVKESIFFGENFFIEKHIKRKFDALNSGIY